MARKMTIRSNAYRFRQWDILGYLTIYRHSGLRPRLQNPREGDQLEFLLPALWRTCWIIRVKYRYTVTWPLPDTDSTWTACLNPPVIDMLYFSPVTDSV